MAAARGAVLSCVRFQSTFETGEDSKSARVVQRAQQHALLYKVLEVCGIVEQLRLERFDRHLQTGGDNKFDSPKT